MLILPSAGRTFPFHQPSLSLIHLMKTTVALLCALALPPAAAPASAASGQPASRHPLTNSRLAHVWDEAVPLGNGLLGALIWEKQGRLRFSLDRADLWDLRPMKGLERPEFRYRWVYGQVMKHDYDVVQKYFDLPYESEPAPTKLPGAALEFGGLSGVASVRLALENALCTVTWKDGARLTVFVHATRPLGWYRFERLGGALPVSLVPPAYGGGPDTSGSGSVQGDNLIRLRYREGPIRRAGNTLTYRQEGWNGFSYTVTTAWRNIRTGVIEGAWSITTDRAGGTAAAAGPPPQTAPAIVAEAMRRGFARDLRSHERWWTTFWSRSSVSLPDSLLERQWYLEQYKFGSASRRGAPPISLQAVWTADNGRLPPWKGDFHHDLNTELSYWPCYAGNHLDEGLAYLDHLDANKDAYRRYTRRYFETDGLAVPGVTTLDGEPMGGWIQYSCSPTISAWLAHHFYLHWRYSMDTLFLRGRAYPWLRETAGFLERITVKDTNGFRQLPISSSPEINDNSLSAWFPENTNYDLALMKFTFRAAAEMAETLGLPEDARRWRERLAEFSGFALTSNDELMFAPALPYRQSHRHFSHAMAIYPLGLIRWEDGERARRIIRNTIAQLDSVGPREWVGYSYAWLGNLKARARDGEGAARALRIFARAFCLPNSFHVNGDQTGSGYSGMTYRPFTLEGNFAFAAGVQEMLLQSYAGFIEVFPAVPARWKDASFSTLRAEGAFLVSAKRKNGRVMEVRVASGRGGTTTLKLPFASWRQTAGRGAAVRPSERTVAGEPSDSFVDLTFRPGGFVVLAPGRPL